MMPSLLQQHSLEQEAIQLVQAGFDFSEAARLNSFHQQLIGDKPEDWYCNTCIGKAKMVFYDLKFKYHNQIKAMATSKYTFKNKSASIRIPFTNEVINSKNLTDARAEKLIKDYPAYKDYFNISKTTSGEELTEKQQLQKQYAELYGEEPADRMTIAQLNEATAEKEGSNE